MLLRESSVNDRVNRSCHFPHPPSRAIIFDPSAKIAVNLYLAAVDSLLSFKERLFSY